MDSLEVNILLVSEEQHRHVQLDTASIAAWPSLQLLDVQRSTHAQLLAALQNVCNLRRSGNLWGFLPEGLPSEYYEMRSDVRRKIQTSYLLVQPTDDLEDAPGSNGAMLLQDLTSLASGSTAHQRPVPFDATAKGKLAIMVTRRSCNYCSNPVHQHSERRMLAYCSDIDSPTGASVNRLKVHVLCALHRSKQESKQMNRETGRRMSKLVSEGHPLQTKRQKQASAPVDLARRISFIAAQSNCWPQTWHAQKTAPGNEAAPALTLKRNRDMMPRAAANNYDLCFAATLGSINKLQCQQAPSAPPNFFDFVDADFLCQELDLDNVLDDVFKESGGFEQEMARQILGSESDDSETPTSSDVIYRSDSSPDGRWTSSWSTKPPPARIAEPAPAPAPWLAFAPTLAPAPWPALAPVLCANNP